MKKIIFLLLASTQLLLAQTPWNVFKHDTIVHMEKLEGWCSREKATSIMDVIYENKCQNCIEVGVFGGKSLLPIARALQYNGAGKVSAVDAWDTNVAIQGLSASDPNYLWWQKVNLKDLYLQTIKMLQKNRATRFCVLVKKSSKEASTMFLDETVDFIHLDGNHTEELAFQDVVDYFPKVKDGGYILLSDPTWYSMKRSLVFLMERADLISTFSPTASFYLFRKNKFRLQRIQSVVVG